MEPTKVKSSVQKAHSFIGFTKNEKRGIFAMLIIIIISPIIFTQFSSLFSFEDTGEIGDTIGGITAPFVNLLAAFLVYKSFTAQIKANEQQRVDHTEQMTAITNEQSINYLINLYELIEKDYFSNEASNEINGWAHELSHGFDYLDLSQDPNATYSSFDRDFETTDHDAFLNNGRRTISNSMDKVAYIYHSFVMLTDALVINNTKSTDRSLMFIVRYIASKVFSLFNANNYNFLIEKDVQSYIDNGAIEGEMGKNILLLKETSILIKSRLVEIMEATNYRSPK